MKLNTELFERRYRQLLHVTYASGEVVKKSGIKDKTLPKASLRKNS